MEDITLKDPNLSIHTKLPAKPVVSMKTLADALEGLEYTLKLPRDVPAEQNTSEVKDDRFFHAEWLTSLTFLNSHKVSIEEFGVNSTTRRNQGRRLRGTRIY